MAKNFVYKRRSLEQWQTAKAAKSSDFEGVFLTDFKAFSTHKGANYLRILPPTWNDVYHYGIYIWVHFSVGSDELTLLCPAKMKDEQCPICQEAARTSVQELKPTKRLAVFILDRDEEDKGPQLWAMPMKVERSLVALAEDARNARFYEIDDPDNGYDFSFNREGEQIKTQYEAIKIAHQPTSVPESALAYISKHPLDTTFNFKTYDEMLKIFTGGVPVEEMQQRPRSAPRGRPDREQTEREPAPPMRGEADYGNGEDTGPHWQDESVQTDVENEIERRRHEEEPTRPLTIRRPTRPTTDSAAKPSNGPARPEGQERSAELARIMAERRANR